MNIHLQRALMLVEQSRHELAQQELRQAIAQDPDDALAHAVLALCLAERESAADALQEAELAIRLAPAEAFVFYVHSVVLSKANRYPEARTRIEEAIRLDPNHPDYFAQLSQIQFDQRRWREALAAAEQGLALDPEHVACTNLRAVALVKTGRKAEAEDALRTALRRDPEDAFSHTNLGWSLVEQKQHEKAMEHFREALRLNPELEWARAGIIEAMKARYFVYRIVLSFFLWMMKLSRKGQWGIILGAYVGYHVLRQAAIANPGLSPWVMPLLVAYVTFVVMTWTASPLFNLVLRLNRFGRLALSREEIKTANRVGACVVAAMAFLAAYFVTGAIELLACGAAAGLLIPPVAHIYHCSPGWPRAAILLITAALGGLALAVLASATAGYWLDGRLAEVVRGIGGLSFLILAVGALASQLGVNALIHVRPRRRSAFAVWAIGGSSLAVLAFLFFAAAGLMIFVTWYEEHALPALFDMPIRTRAIAQANLDWNKAAEVQQATEELLACGFRQLGDYVYEGVENVNVRYLLHEQEAIVAELAEHPQSGFVVSLSTLYTDGRSFSCFNGEPQPIEPPPGFTRKRFVESASGLYQRIRQERPAEAIRTLIGDEVPAISETRYASEIDHLLGRGGPSVAEIQALGEAKGVAVSDATAAQLQARWRREAAAKVDEFVLTRFLEANGTYREARQRILCVHNLLDPKGIVRAYTRAGGKADEIDKAIDVAEDETAREAFEQAASRVAGLKRIGQTEVPVATDIYLVQP